MLAHVHEHSQHVKASGDDRALPSASVGSKYGVGNQEEHFREHVENVDEHAPRIKPLGRS